MAAITISNSGTNWTNSAVFTIADADGVDVADIPADAVKVVLSDTDTYDNGGDGVAVYVGVAGNVSIIPIDGDRTTAVVFKGMAAGSVVPCRAYIIRTTGTTATDLVALS